VESFLDSVREVTAAICNCMFWPTNLPFALGFTVQGLPCDKMCHWTPQVYLPSGISFERLRHGTGLRQMRLTDRSSDRSPHYAEMRWCDALENWLAGCSFNL